MVARGEHRVDDVLIAGAAAEVRGDSVSYLGFVGLRMVAQERGERHQQTGRAESTLQSVRVFERGLKRIERSVRRGETFDRVNLVAVRLDGEHDAGPRRLAVEENRARAADAVLAS